MFMKKNDTALNMLLPSSLYESAKEAAESRNISLAALVRLALTEWLSNKADSVNSISPADISVDDIFDSLPCALNPNNKRGI